MPQMGVEKKIDLYKEPAAFFQEKVTQAMSRQKLETQEIVQFYLVDLLSRFIQTSNLFDIKTQDQSREHELLGAMLLKAQAKDIPGVEKISLLKKLGDTSLYISGFFSESLSRKIIDLDYYREMGCIAYRSLSGVIRDDQFQELYTELHDKFSPLASVLTEISHELHIQNNQDVLRLYELYLQTGSTFAKTQLNEKGLPIPQVSESPKKSKN